MRNRRTVLLEVTVIVPEGIDLTDEILNLHLLKMEVAANSQPETGRVHIALVEDAGEQRA